MTALAENIIGYKSTGLTRGFLKLAMLQHWKGRCAWCKAHMRDTSEFEMDHVIPQHGFGDFVAGQSEVLGYALHDVENLAPLCVSRRCNQEKSDAVDDDAGAIGRMRARAKELADPIRGSVRHMERAAGLERALLMSLAMNLSERRPAELLRQYGTRLAERIYAFDSSIINSVRTNWDVWRDARGFFCVSVCLDDVDVFVDLQLDAVGRSAIELADRLSIHGFDLAHELSRGAEEVAAALDAAAPNDAARVGRPRVEGRALTFDATDCSLRFHLDSYSTCSFEVVTINPGQDGSGLAFEAERFIVGGEFRISVEVRPAKGWTATTASDGSAYLFTEWEWDQGEAHDDRLNEADPND